MILTAQGSLVILRLLMITTLARPRKIKQNELINLKREVGLLRSFMVSIAGEDSEGNYKPEFVRAMLEAAQEKPEFTYKDTQSFLDALAQK